MATPSGRGSIQEEFQQIWKADCIVVRPDPFNYNPDAA